MTGEWLGALAAIMVGLTGLTGVVYATRDKRMSDGRSDITAHAESVLREAMAWQAATIEGLLKRIVALEVEVVACELGRTADRADFDRKLAALETLLIERTDP